MNLAEIESSLYDRLGHNSTPDPSTTRRLRRAINKTHRKLLTMNGMGKLRRAVLTFSSVASSPFAVLPQAAVRIVAICDRTNMKPLDEITLADVRLNDPGLTYSGSIPDAFFVENLAAAVARDPSAASELFVISDAAGDGTGISVSIEGIITGGYYRRATVTMNGLTGVSLGSTITTWEHITKFYVSALATGSITLRQGSGAGTELARIQPGRTYARYTQIHFFGTPSTAQTYYADVELHVEDMLNPKDEPLVPEDFHYLLETGALIEEYARREKIDLLKMEQADWLRGTSDLKGFVGRRAVPAIRERKEGGSQARFSQLGPWFPAGS